jgi:hypothetical protein
MDYHETKDILTLAVGATVTAVDGKLGDEEVSITTDKGQLVFFHSQDCCEHVCLEDLTGDLADLIGGQIVVLEERTSEDDPDGYEDPGYRESWSWTFYEIRTTKGDVTLRWLGQSNGYYSEEVHARWCPNEGEAISSGWGWN